MPVSTIERPVSTLRQRMLEVMAMRGLRSDTQHEYIRRFQLYQRESEVQPPTINSSVSALRFFFTVTLDLSRRLVLARYPRKLPEVLSVEEVAQLLCNSVRSWGDNPEFRAGIASAERASCHSASGSNGRGRCHTPASIRAACRTIAAPFSAIMMVGAFVLVDVTAGITEASITRSPRSPCTRN
jgi:hypothetical protein